MAGRHIAKVDIEVDSTKSLFLPWMLCGLLWAMTWRSLAVGYDVVRGRFRRRGVLQSHQNILSINFGNTREGLYEDATNRNLNERHCGSFSKCPQTLVFEIWFPVGWRCLGQFR